MKKYLIEKLWTFEYDYDMAVVKELKNNDKKWNVSFVEYNVKDTISKGDIVKVELFIQYVRKDLKIDMNSELSATQPLPNSLLYTCLFFLLTIAQYLLQKRLPMIPTSPVFKQNLPMFLSSISFMFLKFILRKLFCDFTKHSIPRNLCHN